MEPLRYKISDRKPVFHGNRNLTKQKIDKNNITYSLTLSASTTATGNSKPPSYLEPNRNSMQKPVGGLSLLPLSTFAHYSLSYCQVLKCVNIQKNLNLLSYDGACVDFSFVADSCAVYDVNS
jgi:hypothetical protein